MQYDEERAIELSNRLLHRVENERVLGAQDVDHLVHYTSFAALESIVGKREIWLSPVSSMNDVDEVASGKSLIWREAEAHVGRLWPTFEPIWTNDEELWAQISREFNDRIVHDRDETFVSCWSAFSNECFPDGRHKFDELSMWRAYGASGNGVALIFDPAVLFRHSHLGSGIISTRVHYQTEEQFVEKARICFADFALTVVSLSPIERATYNDLIVGSFAELCFFLSATHKHPAFELENEWRFIWNRKPWSSQVLVNQLRATLSRDGLYERLVMPFGDQIVGDEDEVKLRDALIAVMVGPCSQSDLKARGVKQLLADSDFDNTEVLISPIPFRA